MIRKLCTALSLTVSLALLACGGSPPGTAGDDEEATRQTQVTCYAYLLDQSNYTGPLDPFPVANGLGVCVNLPAVSDNRTSSFRLANCGAIFFDGASCSGTSYSATTSGVMPFWMDNRTTSLRFF